MKTSGPGFLFDGRFLTVDSVFLIVISVFIFSICS